jgi:Retroviral aspartyl protease.
MVEVSLTSSHHRTRTVRGIFDTGADYSVLDPQWIEQLRVAAGECIPWDVTTASGAHADGKLTLLEARLDTRVFQMPVIFLPGVPTDVFGRVGLFDRFKISMDPHAEVTTFDWLGEGTPWAETIEAYWKRELAKAVTGKPSLDG